VNLKDIKVLRGASRSLAERLIQYGPIDSLTMRFSRLVLCLVHGQPPVRGVQSLHRFFVTGTYGQRFGSYRANIEKLVNFTQQSHLPLSGKQTDIEEATRACESIADSLISTIKNICEQNKGTLWGSFREALRTMWSKRYIEDLESRLETYQRQTNILIAAATR
jgi:hypothetical protein